MEMFNKLFSSIFLAATILCSAVAVDAMDLKQFDKLSPHDQGEFFGDLTQGAIDLLKQQGKLDRAELIQTGFTKRAQGEKISVFMKDVEENLKIVRELNLQLEAKKDSRRAQVETALAETFKKYGIDVSNQELLKIGKKSKYNAEGKPSTAK
jgi:hypothetical protein